jgi:hypothetical protein
MNTPPQGSSFGEPPRQPPQAPQPLAPQPPHPGLGLEPNRGALVLALGILSIVFSVGSIFCCMPAGLIGVAFGAPAIMMGQADLAKYAAGTMDPTDQPSTHAGWICGIIGCVIAGLELLGVVFIAVVYGSLFGFALLGAASGSL